tara:strand:- start:44030 stop:44629 length:600 start_codon:yes stop_codon:yes gene_type:complete
MYKVFINESLIILTDSLLIDNNFKIINYKNTVIPEIINKLKKEKRNNIILYCINLQESWEHFKSHFKIIIAAGGLVLNENKEFLFIFRGSKWDLPKGRIEEEESIKETALREVKEECGVSQLKLHEFLIITYHIFYQNNQNRLKETHWFHMETRTKEVLKPQLEEGITIAEFKNKEDSVRALDNTYGNIHLVFKAYYQK